MLPTNYCPCISGLQAGAWGGERDPEWGYQAGVFSERHPAGRRLTEIHLTQTLEQSAPICEGNPPETFHVNLDRPYRRRQTQTHHFLFMKCFAERGRFMGAGCEEELSDHGVVGFEYHHPPAEGDRECKCTSRWGFYSTGTHWTKRTKTLSVWLDELN